MPRNKLLFILFLLLFSFSFKEKAHAQLSEQIVNVIVGNFIDDGSSGLGGGALPSCSEIDGKLKADFGVVFRRGEGQYGGDGSFPPGETVDCATKRLAYRAYSIPGQSAAFLKLLNPSDPFNIDCYRDEGIPGASGFVDSPNRMQYRNCYKIKDNFEPYAFLFLHETGHVMKQRNYRKLQQEFPRSYLYRMDRNCFGDEPVIKTYNRRGLTDYSLTSESSAEAIALYVYNKKNGEYGDISNFRSQCPTIYNWVRDNVFNGYTFN